MVGSRMLAAALGFAVLGFVVSAKAADECEKRTETIKSMVDKIDDKSKKTDPGKCATFAEGLGMMKTFRIVRSECLERGEKRLTELVELDTTIRSLQSIVDGKCH
jgi:hypothetical protein